MISYNPRIVTNGLVTALDAANIKSYSGSGSTWFDVSGNGNHATLVGTPTFVSSYQGSFNITTTTQYITLSNNLNLDTLASTRNFTMFFGALKTNYSYTAGGNSMFIQGSVDGYNTGWRVIENSVGTTATVMTVPQQYAFSSPAVTTTIYATDTVLGRFGVVGFAQNGSTVTSFINQIAATSSAFPAYSTGTAGATVGRQLSGVGSFIGYIGFILFYNRTLSSDEMMQNYYAYRGRYGI